MAPPKKRLGTDELLRRWEADKKSRIFLQLAEEYRKQDFVDAAVSVLRDGLKHHPNFQPAHVALARCYMSKRQWTEAQAELERVHAKSPDNLLAGKLLVEVLEGRGEKNQALVVAKQLVPFAAFDDPEVEATAKRLEAELAGPVVKIAGMATTTGTGTGTGGGDTMEFGTAEVASDSTQDVSPVLPSEVGDDEAMLIDAEAFMDEEESVGPPPLPSATPERDADSTHEELAATTTVGAVSPAPPPLDADSTHDELAAAGSAPLVVERPPMPGSEEEPPVDLLGQAESEPAPAPAHAASSSAVEDDLTSRTLAELYEAQNSPHEAAAIYEKLLERRPDDVEVRAALEQCRLRIEGQATGETTVAESASVAPPEPSAEVPKWEPAPAVPAPAPVPQPAAEEADPARLQAMLAEYERWLTAVRAVMR